MRRSTGFLTEKVYSLEVPWMEPKIANCPSFYLHVDKTQVDERLESRYNYTVESGRSAARLAHQHGGLGVGGSNPLAPILTFLSNRRTTP